MSKERCLDIKMQLLLTLAWLGQRWIAACRGSAGVNWLLKWKAALVPVSRALCSPRRIQRYAWSTKEQAHHVERGDASAGDRFNVRPH